jgi:CBS domain-containing protein
VPGAILPPRASVAEAVASHVLRHGLRTLYVTEGERLLGIATLRELAAVPEERRETTPLESIMVPVARMESLAPGDSALAALQRLVGARVNQLPVLDAGRLLGVLTRERLFTLLETELSLSPRGRAAPGAARS